MPEVAIAKHTTKANVKKNLISGQKYKNNYKRSISG